MWRMQEDGCEKGQQLQSFCLHRTMSVTSFITDLLQYKHACVLTLLQIPRLLAASLFRHCSDFVFYSSGMEQFF